MSEVLVLLIKMKEKTVKYNAGRAIMFCVNNKNPCQNTKKK